MKTIELRYYEKLFLPNIYAEVLQSIDSSEFKNTYKPFPAPERLAFCFRMLAWLPEFNFLSM